jgi:hypothetical protein
MSKFSAQESSLGYYYQSRYALYLLFKARTRENAVVRLEIMDDVEIGDEKRTDLIQTKYHVAKAPPLTNFNVDFWKTIRVWSDLIVNNKIDLDNATFMLATTANVDEAFALYDLEIKNRTSVSVKMAVSALEKITTTSTNAILKSAFETFNKLTTLQKEKLICSIYIRDNELNMNELDKAIRCELCLFIPLKHMEKAIESLYGWWENQVMLHLQHKKDKITFDELKTETLFLAEKYNLDALPIDDDIRGAKIDEKEYENSIFVHQLKSIGIGSNVLYRAKLNFYKAVAQRSKWLRETLMHPDEEIVYEKKLCDHWEDQFAEILDAHAENDCDEDIIKMKCKEFFKNFLPLIFIREHVREEFITRGSCQMLANKNKIVWHPKFNQNK